MVKKIIFVFALFFALFLFSKYNAGESRSTRNINNACKMMQENPDWYISATESFDKWGTPVYVQLAIIRQESSFVHDAKPIRDNKWYEFGEQTQSSALGYSQALVGTWQHYLNETKSIAKDRESFKDATDFIGWYNKKSFDIAYIRLNDPKNLYYAYHEGWEGYKNRTHLSKNFLIEAAENVEKWSAKYESQLDYCKVNTEVNGWYKLSMFFDHIIEFFSIVFTLLYYVFLVLKTIFVFIYDLFV